MSHSFVASLYIGLAAAAGGLALTWARGLPGSAVIASLALLSLGLWAFVRLKERARPAGAS